MTTKKAYLAGGCFWGMEELFRKREGVVDTQVGYMGKDAPDPEDRHPHGHIQTVEITYDSEITSYQKLLDFFFMVHDPTTKDKQGNDWGFAYRSGIFYQNEDEKSQAEGFIQIVNNSGRWPNPVITVLEPFEGFHPAESFHQDYLQKSIHGYTCHYVRFPSYL